MKKLEKLCLAVIALLSSILCAHGRERLPELNSINTHSVCTSNIESCKNHLKIDAAKMPMYVSRGEGKINTIIIIVHGMNRNANEYLHDFISNVKVQPALSNVAVIAPHFLEISDPFQKDELRWNEELDSSWKYGYSSAAPIKMSSFQVIDHLVQSIDEKWHPKKIIIAGHSAGAQYVQRYANGSQVSKKIKSTLTYVVSNPSSYLYSNDVRLINNQWDVPNIDCPEYNDYIYGLKNRNEYLMRLDDDQIGKNYLQNNLIYFMGEEDKLSEDLDTGCEANLQGSNRIERAVHFFKYLNEYEYGHRHQFITVPGVAHDHVQMFSSPQFLNIITQEENIDIFKNDLTISHLGNQDIKNKKPYESYFLMGGGDDIDEAFLEFLKATDGGDILVLSAQQTPIGYDRYLLNLAKKNGLPLNSVTTVLIHNRNASENSKFLELIAHSEGIFFSGGDQWNYVSRIKGTSAHKEILKKLKSGIPFGGTSAGLAILGGTIFTAELDSIGSDDVFNDPLNEKIKLMRSMFNISNLENILTDTHFKARDRMGRLISFLANWYHSTNSFVNGLGVDEDAVLVLNGKGLAHIIGPGAAYLLTPSTVPQIAPQHFMWKNIEVRKMRANKEYSLKHPEKPDYFFNIEDGKITSSQNDGAIY
jgi:cyanophycinase